MTQLISEARWNAMDEIVGTIADERGVEPDELPPLYETVDTDALEALVASASDAYLSVELTYAGHHVVVTGDGSVSISRVDGEAPPAERV